ncbi:Protein FAR-RED ELONGATED HYPOCOTYL 3, partial [Bienertia sinuspersici]
GLLPEGKKGSLVVETLYDPPIVGMVFPTQDDLDNFFRRYAKQQGFGVVSGCNSTWKCESIGKPDPRVRASGRLLNGVSKKGVQMPTRKTKVGCLVMLHVKLMKEGEWRIRSDVQEHKNHEPIFSMSKYISMFYRDDLNVIRRRLFQQHDEGVRAKTKQCCRQEALTEVNGRGCKCNELGDVVCFDSTYLTNKYLLLVANFISSNHHDQSVLLGCALILLEDADTYE